jgi:hypothetical protein
MVEKTAAFRQRRVQDTQRWRERLERGAIVLPIEVDGELFDLMARLRLLEPSRATDRRATVDALEKLLRLALGALKRELGSR